MNRSQRVAQESPGALLDVGLKGMRGLLDPGCHQGGGDRKHGPAPHVTRQLTTVALSLKGRKLGLTSESDLRTLSEILDHLLLGHLDAGGNILMQWSKPVEWARKSGGAVASRLELIARPSAPAISSEERGAALALEGGGKKLQGPAKGLRKGRA